MHEGEGVGVQGGPGAWEKRGRGKGGRNRWTQWVMEDGKKRNLVGGIGIEKKWEVG